MPPRQSTQARVQQPRTRPQQQPARVTTGPTSQSSDVPARCSQRSHTQATGLAQGENFNLDDISGSDDDDNAQPVRQPGGRPQDVTPLVQGEGSGVNDPSITRSIDSKPAADIRFFFDKSSENMTCKECR